MPIINTNPEVCYTNAIIPYAVNTANGQMLPLKYVELPSILNVKYDTNVITERNLIVMEAILGGNNRLLLVSGNPDNSKDSNSLQNQEQEYQEQINRFNSVQGLAGNILNNALINDGFGLSQSERIRIIDRINLTPKTFVLINYQIVDGGKPTHDVNSTTCIFPL